jgi:hypothetical protein
MMTPSEGNRLFSSISTLEYVPGVHVMLKGCPATGMPVYVKSLSATAIAARHMSRNAHHIFLVVETREKMEGKLRILRPS